MIGYGTRQIDRWQNGGNTPSIRTIIGRFGAVEIQMRNVSTEANMGAEIGRRW